MKASRTELHRAAMQAWVDAEVRELSIELAVEMVLAQEQAEATAEGTKAAKAHAEQLIARLRAPAA